MIILLRGKNTLINEIYRIEHMEIKDKNFINEIKNGIYQVKINIMSLDFTREINSNIQFR